MKKQDVCVYIKNEAQLKEARELLEKYGEKESNDSNAMDFVYARIKHNYLTKFCDGWFMSRYHWNETQITLSELEGILKADL